MGRSCSVPLITQGCTNSERLVDMQSQDSVRVRREISIPFPISPVMPEVHQFLKPQIWEWSSMPPFSSCSNIQSTSLFHHFPKLIVQIHPQPLCPSSDSDFNITTSLSLIDHSSLLTVVSALSPVLLRVTLHSAVRINFCIISCWCQSPLWNPPKTFQCILTEYRAMYVLPPALYHWYHLFLSPLHWSCPSPSFSFSLASNSSALLGVSL